MKLEEEQTPKKLLSEWIKDTLDQLKLMNLLEILKRDLKSLDGFQK